MATDIDRIVRRSDKHEFQYGKRTRTFLPYHPPNLNSSQAISLVLVLHGAGANGENAMRMVDMESLADQSNFILLYPDGYGREMDRTFTWNSGHCCGLAMDEDSDDVGFLKDLIQNYIENFSVDSNRVYITGLSNGAMMAHRMACEFSEGIAAIAPVAGSLNFDQKNPVEPVSVISFHGTKDDYAPYSGGIGHKSAFKRVDQPVEESVKFWVKNNQCNDAPKATQFGSVNCSVYAGGKKNSEVIHYKIEGQGHAWPGGQKGLRYGNVDDPDPSLNASKLIWQFFESHPKISDA